MFKTQIEDSRLFVEVANLFHVCINRTEEGLIIDVYNKEQTEVIATCGVEDLEAAQS